jgi:hypothetical protein
MHEHLISANSKEAQHMMAQSRKGQKEWNKEYSQYKHVQDEKNDL